MGVPRGAPRGAPENPPSGGPLGDPRGNPHFWPPAGVLKMGVPPVSITLMDPGPWLSPELYIMGEVTNSSYIDIR